MGSCSFYVLTFYLLCDIILVKVVLALICTCKVCGKEFEATHVTALCPEHKYRKCVICGKKFLLQNPYTKVTCSRKCAGIYRKQSGLSKQVAEKAKATMIERYGVSNAAAVSGPKTPKICKYCGKEFIPDNYRQVYCNEPHYGPCPVCGKPVLIKEMYIGPQCCSPECTQKLREQTNMERYGVKAAAMAEQVKDKIKNTNLERYGVTHYSKTEEYKEKYKNTIRERYGVDSPLQAESIKAKWHETSMTKYGTPIPAMSKQVRDKINATAMSHGGYGMQRPEVRAKIEATNLERYGCASSLGNSEIRAKAKNTIKLRYGVDNPLKCKTILSKLRTTNVKRYGFPTALQNPTVKQKALDTLYNHYGILNPMESTELVQKSQENLKNAMLLKYGKPYSMQIDSIRQKMSDTFLEKYGVPWYCMTEDCNAANSQRISKPNALFARRLESAGIGCEFEKLIECKPYDLYIPDMHTLIEVDPTYTHNSFGNHWNPEGLDAKYHLLKTQLAQRNGYRCVHIFDWEQWNKIIDLFKHKQVIYARNCEIRNVDTFECLFFENKYHLQGSVRKQAYKFGLYYNGKLVELMTFGIPRYNKAYQWELLRLCTHTDYKVVGGASKLFKHFIKECDPVSIISYCDLSKFTGSVYTAIGMTLDHTSAPAKHWSKSTEHITDNLLRQRGYDQLFGTDYGKGESNEKLMLENGWLPVYDCGQAVYVWHK